jgi:hypothetical protein
MSAKTFKNISHCGKYIVYPGEGLHIRGPKNAINLRRELKLNLNIEPCWKYITNSPLKQAIHIKQEADEVIDALYDKTPQDADMEVMDTIQSCITYFAIKGYSQETVDELAAEMHKKNCSNGRDYYRKGGS